MVLRSLPTGQMGMEMGFGGVIILFQALLFIRLETLKNFYNLILIPNKKLNPA